MIRFDDIEAQFGSPEPYGDPFITKRKLVKKHFLCNNRNIYNLLTYTPMRGWIYEKYPRGIWYKCRKDMGDA